MSGGSYNYLFIKDASDVMANLTDLNDMACYMERQYPDTQATKDFKELQDIVVKAREVVQFRLDKLQDVMKAVEWCASGDWNREDEQKFIAEYHR